MKLAAWRKREGKTQEWLAEQLGCTQPYVSQIERATHPIVPGTDILERIYMVTSGEVEPNDFHDVPRWRRALQAARALLTRQAA